MQKKATYESLITGREWYHQRFDGSPMFLFAVGEAETRIETRKPRGTEANVRVCFFSNGGADWYLDMEDVERGARAIIELAKKDPKLSTKLLRAWKKDEKVFDKFFWKEFPKIHLRKLSNEELLPRLQADESHLKEYFAQTGWQLDQKTERAAPDEIAHEVVASLFPPRPTMK